MARIPGHGLQREGRAHEMNGRYTGEPAGFGLCECGAISPHLSTTAARQRWHQDHKAELLDQDKEN